MAPDPREAPQGRQSPEVRAGTTMAGEVVGWPLFTLLLPVAPLLLILPSAWQEPQRQPLLLADDEPVLSRPFRLESGWLGSPSLELNAELPKDSSAVLNVSLLDGQGRTRLDLSKDAWREIGTWREEGTSGTYDESDAAVPLELRPDRAGDFRLRVVLDELLDAAGKPRTDPVMASLSVRNHNLDGGLLAGTSFVAALMVVLLWKSVYGDCRRRVVRVDEGAIDLRLPVGGAGLLRLSVQARYEPREEGGESPYPSATPLRLRLDDRLGRSRLDSDGTLDLRRSSNDGDVWWSGSAEFLFRLGEPDNLRLRVELNETLPDVAAELESLELVVEDGFVCCFQQVVNDLTPAAAAAPAVAGAAATASPPPRRLAPESLLILALLLAAVLGGSAAAVSRPGLYRLGQEGTPTAGSGVRFLGTTRAGRWHSQQRHSDWSRFPGRGPGPAK